MTKSQVYFFVNTIVHIFNVDSKQNANIEMFSYTQVEHVLKNVPVSQEYSVCIEVDYSFCLYSGMQWESGAKTAIAVG